MSSKVKILIVLFSFGLSHAYAQSIKTDKKALAFLASEEKVNVIFAYNEILYNTDDLTEKDFLAHIHAKITKHGTAQMARDWREEFINARKKTWPEAFVKALNDELIKYKNAPRFVLNEPNTNYIMVVHTHQIDFGFDAGVIKKPADAKIDIYFYKASDKENFITKSKVSEAKGLYNESRYKNENWPKPSLKSIQNLYERVAPNLAKSLKRIVK